MFVNKKQDQKLELMRALFRNMYLKEKHDYLDSECKMLAEHLLSGQVTKNVQNDKKSTLENELNDLRVLHEEKVEELSRAKETVVNLSISLEKMNFSALKSIKENKSMYEELEFKDEMIKCLQDKLVKDRLQAEEKWALIRELKQMKNELEKDLEALNKVKPKTISCMQQEFIQSKFLQTQNTIEFNKIRKILKQMKTELDTHIKENVHGKDHEGKIKISRKGVFWKSKDNNNAEQAEILENIQYLEEEKLHLLTIIPELRHKIEILSQHIQYKETERRKLQEKFNSAMLKHQSVDKITTERKRQYDHFNNSASEKVWLIRNSTLEKSQSIDQLEERLQEISGRRTSYTGILHRKELNTIQALEDKIVTLENKIAELKTESFYLHREACRNRKNVNSDDVELI